MEAPQLIAMLAFLGVVAWFAIRSARGKGGGQGAVSVEEGLAGLRAGFQQTRDPDEEEPVCVVAFHYATMSVSTVIVGVTDRRVLVFKGAGPLYGFPYDHDGEHLGEKEKNKQGKGFFRWSHGSFKDGSEGYSPTVKDHPPFAGEEWRMYPEIPGHPEQKQNLREFADRFYFQWFYD